MNELFRWLLIVFFATHIPITIVVDSQVVFPRHLYPHWAKALFDFHLESNMDFLFRDCRTLYPYVRWIGACEVFLQLPFFFYAILMLWKKSNAIRVPAIVYCSHVITTVRGVFFFLAFTMMVLSVVL